MSGNNGWIGVDLDGTLAHYDGWKGPEHIGEPIKPMVDRVKQWLAEGKTVKIFTARAWPVGTSVGIYEDFTRVQEAERAIQVIARWCKEHIGQPLPITCVKDFSMIELWDDRAVQVKLNTGDPVAESVNA